MDPVVLFFATAVGWFSMICLRIAALIYQFVTFPSTFGKTTNISLQDLSKLAKSNGADLPSFNIVIPAYQESLVIDGTLERIAALNYPHTHFDAWVVTYQDEQPVPGQDSTYHTAKQAAVRINGLAGRELVKTLSVPAGFDGQFPGELDASEKFVGKPRGLNFALRTIHQTIERDERSLFVGKMVRLGNTAAVDAALEAIAEALRIGPDALDATVGNCLVPDRSTFVGPCTLSSQVRRVQELWTQSRDLLGSDHSAVRNLSGYMDREAPRFFLQREPSGTDELSVLKDRCFLHEIMQEVESEDCELLAERSRDIEARLVRERPQLAHDINMVRQGDELFQLCRQVNSRWMAVYDADADAPVDVFRHLAARILTDPEVMGFQGPVSPIANYDEVHPLCKLGGLWMGFWHSTGYPRLLSRESWAHVLAGTNWCLRIDGFWKSDRLVRSGVYQESERALTLSFDPRQLTEDLEVAVRIFDKWEFNAQWQPYVEFEQVPASPQAMIVQRRRWTLGTLQTVSFMLRSRIPITQKLKYGLLPLDIVFSGSGPIVTVFLWVLIYTGDLISSPVLIAWSIVLTFGNIVYVLPYLLAHERFVMGSRRSAGLTYAMKVSEPLSRKVQARIRSGAVSHQEADLLREIAEILEIGQKPGGFIRRYLAERCVEDPADATAPALVAVTPSSIRETDVVGMFETYADLSEQSNVAVSPKASPDTDLLTELENFRSAIEKSAGVGPWRVKRRQERRQIWLWAFVYLFWQLIPYYSGLLNWLTGRNSNTWVKTPRTKKNSLATPD